MSPTNHIFCDESHINTHAYRVQGGIWVPDIGMRAVRAEFRALRAKHPRFGEFKWSYVTGPEPMRAYLDLIDLFFKSDVAPVLTFNCLVIRRADDSSQALDKTGQDLGFFKAYYTLLRYRLWHGSDNHVRIDEKSSPRDTPTTSLQECLNDGAQHLERPFRVLSCKMARSHDEDLLQLADVFCGLIGWAHNGMKTTCGAKPKLDAYVAAHFGRRSMQGYTTGPWVPKFNVWLYRPKKK